MGFNPTFYAGRPKLSEVTIDSDLNMGGRNISSVDTIGVNLIRAGRVDSPYMPHVWETEELDWGDRPAETVLPSTRKTWSVSAPDVRIYTANIGGYYTLTMDNVHHTFRILNTELRINGVTVATYPSLPLTADLLLNAGDVLSVYSTTYGGSVSSADAECTAVFSGIIGGAKTFDLTGKWLALGLNMQGLAATVKIQGVEIPYSDYAKYFPLAPSELKIPGNWDVSQTRPVVEVYV